MEYEVRTTEDFDAWLNGVSDPVAQRAIATRLVRVAGGLFGHVETVGGGVSELKVDVGQGYRAYYTIRQRTVVFMLCGGDKSTQKRDIKRAKEMAAQID